MKGSLAIGVIIVQRNTQEIWGPKVFGERRVVRTIVSSIFEDAPFKLRLSGDFLLARPQATVSDIQARSDAADTICCLLYIHPAVYVLMWW
jgi:hypothetical protein